MSPENATVGSVDERLVNVPSALLIRSVSARPAPPLLAMSRSRSPSLSTSSAEAQ